MDLPLDSSDIQIAFACQICNGNGSMGSRTRDGGNPHQPCTGCNASGWTLKRPKDLTAMELARLVQRLPQLGSPPSGCGVSPQTVTGASRSNPPSSITGTIIEAGDDPEGQPRITIHTSREELLKCPSMPLYQKSRITFETITP